MAETPNDRVFEVRRSLGDKRRPLAQERFAELLTEAAQRLGLSLRYWGSTVSDIEAGNRGVTLDDCQAVAFVDPLNRGPGWVAFGGGNTPIIKEQEAETDITAAHQVPTSTRATGTRGPRRK